MVETVYVSIDEELATEIGKRAGSMNLSPGKYIQLVLEECLEWGNSQDTLPEA